MPKYGVKQTYSSPTSETVTCTCPNIQHIVWLTFWLIWHQQQRHVHAQIWSYAHTSLWHQALKYGVYKTQKENGENKMNEKCIANTAMIDWTVPRTCPNMELANTLIYWLIELIDLDLFDWMDRLNEWTHHWHQQQWHVHAKKCSYAHTSLWHQAPSNMECIRLRINGKKKINEKCDTVTRTCPNMELANTLIDWLIGLISILDSTYSRHNDSRHNEDSKGTVTTQGTAEK